MLHCVPKAWLTDIKCVPKAWLTDINVPKAWLTDVQWRGGRTYIHTDRVTKHCKYMSCSMQLKISLFWQKKWISFWNFHETLHLSFPVLTLWSPLWVIPLIETYSSGPILLDIIDKNSQVKLMLEVFLSSPGLDCPRPRLVAQVFMLFTVSVSSRLWPNVLVDAL